MIVEALGFELEITPWMKRARCAGSDIDMFFPGHGVSAEQARAVCADCPVRSDCLDYALRWKVSHGVWGGLTERERRRLEPQTTIRRLPAAHGTTTRYARGCRCEGCRAAGTDYQSYWRSDRSERDLA